MAFVEPGSGDDGTRLFTPASGLALMVFFVLACQCMSTVAVVRATLSMASTTGFMAGSP